MREGEKERNEKRSSRTRVMGKKAREKDGERLREEETRAEIMAWASKGLLEKVREVMRWGDERSGGSERDEGWEDWERDAGDRRPARKFPLVVGAQCAAV